MLKLNTIIYYELLPSRGQKIGIVRNDSNAEFLVAAKLTAIPSVMGGYEIEFPAASVAVNDKFVL
ncbi:hypothetical protein COY32_05975 [candidate division WWE3 bacterium CG_4_10_14_0_2_um_filter_41_14]|uniref:Uncharacterized protein n=1 Tax=candidate division WWE3 bacterium CG_4_10_14_0_2_um_filter_41_14 TaxID=1975072 RepID=A0A2M7TFS8_UNCKA|nr:MAG: hypothetical protein COY32_05975 [candidate division WWE3 bacterium CG_4_10_14_0_2_um_filter_41_14]